MLADDALPRECSIAALVRFTHLSASGFLNRRATLSVSLLQALIAPITQAFNRGGQADVAAFAELEIMLTAFAYSRAEDLPPGLIDQKLGLLGMAALLAPVVPALFFCGRSTGLSVASITMTSNCVSLAWSFFFPGR